MTEDQHPSPCGACRARTVTGDRALELTRRGFVSAAAWSMISAAVAACGTGGGLETVVTGPDASTAGVTLSGSTATIDLTQATVLAASEGFLVINAWPAIVIHLADGSYRAFTAVCTHEGCTVDGFNGTVIECPCHGSTFNTSGTNVGGPAPSPLQAFTLTQTGTTLTVTRGS